MTTDATSAATESTQDLAIAAQEFKFQVKRQKDASRLNLATIDQDDPDTRRFLEAFGATELAKRARSVTPDSAQDDKLALVDAAKNTFLFNRRVGAAAVYTAALTVATIRDCVVGEGESEWYKKVAQTGVCSQAEAYNLVRIIDNGLSPTDIEDPLTGGSIDKTALNKLLAKKAQPNTDDPNSAISRAIASTKQGEKVTAEKAQEFISEATGQDPARNTPAPASKSPAPASDETSAVDAVDVEVEVEDDLDDDLDQLERQSAQAKAALDSLGDEGDSNDNDNAVLNALLKQEQAEKRQLQQRLENLEKQQAPITNPITNDDNGDHQDQIEQLQAQIEQLQAQAEEAKEAQAQAEEEAKAQAEAAQPQSQTGKIYFELDDLADFFADWLNIWKGDRQKTLRKLVYEGHSNANTGEIFNSFAETFGIDEDLLREAEKAFEE